MTICSGRRADAADRNPSWKGDGHPRPPRPTRLRGPRPALGHPAHQGAVERTMRLSGASWRSSSRRTRSTARRSTSHYR